MPVKISLLFVLALVILANGASISKPDDSYRNVREENDIKENLVGDEGEDIEGLLPPRPDAVNYFHTEVPRRESSYIIDRENNTLILKGQAKNEEEELNSEEKEAIRKVTTAFEKLLTKAQATAGDSYQPSLQPVVILSDDGIAVELAGVDKKSDEVNIREKTTTDDDLETTTIPYGETETFTTDDIPADEARDDEESGLLHFFQNVWNVVRSSVEYASYFLRGLTSKPTSTETPVTEASSTESSASSASSLVAFEEPLFHQILPAHEFEKGGRDVDSLFYGRGIA